MQRKPDNVDAWRLLGTVHAENDDDTQAIAAMAHALKADPTNAEVGCPFMYLHLMPVCVTDIGWVEMCC